jgi:phage shock protein PspC (stress-responsive transcriptional regulator)
VCGDLGQYFNVNPAFLRLALLIPHLRKPSA